jgi:SAM-dependent methyltransferase
MLTEPQRAELRGHLSAMVKEMEAAVRSIVDTRSSGHLVSRLMLDHASRFVASQRAIEMPESAQLAQPDAWLSQFVSRFGDSTESIIGQILSRETDWLGAHSALLSWYGSELLRMVTARPWSDGAESLTSRTLEDVVSTLVSTLLPDKTVGLSAFDPTCGMGTLLNAVAELAGNDTRLCGQDLSYDVARLAAQNLFVAGRDATIRLGDTLKEDAFPGENYDIVVADAPYGVHCDRQERFQFTPPRSDATFLFIQALLAKMKPAEEGGGIGIFFSAVNPLTSTSRGYSEIREAISDLDMLHSVIALPDGLNARTNIRLFALVFSTRKATDWRGKTKLIDLRGQYEDNRVGPERRKLTAQALTDLERESVSTKDSAIGRLVPTSRFSFLELPLARPGSTRSLDSETVRRAGYSVMVPAEARIPEWLADRYPLGSQPDVLGSGNRQTVWDIDKFFKSQGLQELQKSLKVAGWPSTRLSAFVGQLLYIRSASAPERDEQVAGLAGGNRLIIPVDNGREVVTGDPEEVLTRHRGVILDLLPGLDPDFASGWLNSAAGRLARAVAATAAGLTDFPRTVSHRQAWALIDEIVIPVPAPSDQEAFVRAHAAIAAGFLRLRELNESMWRAPGTIGDARQAAGRLLTTGTLDEWAQTLPYPMASALVTVLSDRAPDPQQYRHFWEATAIFLACYLLGALQQDGSLWDAEIPVLIETVKGTGSSFEKTTFGTWKAVLDRLSRLFREGLNSADADERARYNQLLGNPPRDLITRILSTEVGRLVGEAIVMRNKMDAHGGTMSTRQRSQYRQAWDTLTSRLRDAIGPGFSEFILVRPGLMDHDGEKFLNYAKAIVGPATPFKLHVVSTIRPLSNKPFPDYLYLVSPSGDYTRLAPFVRIGSRFPGEDPDDADFTCYFYNRRENAKSNELRFIAYQLAREDQVIREYPEVLSLVETLTRPDAKSP